MNNERNTSDILKELLKQNQNFTSIIKLCHKIDFDEKLDEVDADIINYILNQLEYIHGNNKLINILHIKKYLQANNQFITEKDIYSRIFKLSSTPITFYAEIDGEDEVIQISRIISSSKVMDNYDGSRDFNNILVCIGDMFVNQN